MAARWRRAAMISAAMVAAAVAGQIVEAIKWVLKLVDADVTPRPAR